MPETNYVEFETTIEVPIKVKYIYDRGERGCRDSMGVPEEPDIDPYIDDMEIIYPEDLDEEKMEQLKEEAMENHRENLESAYLASKGL